MKIKMAVIGCKERGHLLWKTTENISSDCQSENVQKHFHTRRKRRTKKLITLQGHSEFFLVCLYVMLQVIFLVTITFTDAKLYPNNINPSTQVSQDFTNSKKIYLQQHHDINWDLSGEMEYRKDKLPLTRSPLSPRKKRAADVKTSNNERKQFSADRVGRRLTAYACEDSRLNISCGNELYLDIIRANYGRFSITICNEHGNTDWKVDCQAGRTLRAMQARCGNKHICDVPVDSSIFGDPCPGTFKYIEVHYACRREPTEISTTTPRTILQDIWYPDPIQIIPDPNPGHWEGIKEGHNDAMKNNTSGQTNEDTTKSTENLFPRETESSTKKTIIVKVPKVPANFGKIQGISLTKPHLPIELPKFDPLLPQEPRHHTRPVQIIVNFTQYCPPTRSRGLFWNLTKAGDQAVLKCPNGSTGFAKWTCQYGIPQAKWSKVWVYGDENEEIEGPNLSECLSTWMSDLDAGLRSGEISVINASQTLAEMTSNRIIDGGVQKESNGDLYGGDILLATRMLKDMSQRMQYEILQTVDANTRESMVTSLVQNVVRIASNLLHDRNRNGWADLGSNGEGIGSRSVSGMGLRSNRRTDHRGEIGRAVTALMIGLEENAFLLADAVTSEKVIIKPTENILLSIRVMQARNTHRQRFPSFEEDITGSSWKSTGDTIELASQALLANGDNGAVRVVFVAYHQLNKLLSMAFFAPEYENSLKQNANENHQESLGRLTDSDTKSAHLTSSTFLNSKVVCASLGRGRHIELPQPVVITLKHIKKVNNDKGSSGLAKNTLTHRKVQEATSLQTKLVPKCVYWDYLSNYWSQDGCKVLATNETHTRCQCNHLTNFALLMSTEGSNFNDLDSVYADDLKKNSRFLYSSGQYDIRAVASNPVEKAPMMSKNVSTIVASIATLISVSIIGFFVIMAWQKLRVSTQCRSALGKTGLPCFHKGRIDGNHGVNGGRNGHGNNNANLDDNATEADSESAAGGKDKGNKGNFYTVTPKLTFNFNRLSSSGNNVTSNVAGTAGNVSEDEDGETPELVEAQQFFEHMISLQKNQDNVVGNTNTNKSSRRASANLSNINENPNAQDNCDEQQSIQLNNIRSPSNSQKHSQHQQQMLVMNNLQSSNLHGGVSTQNTEIIYPKRNNYARALSPYNHIYMEIPDGGHIGGTKENNATNTNDHQPQQLSMPLYEPLSHLSETYMMSTLSDLSEDNYNQGVGLNYNSISDVSRQSSHRESRPLLRSNNLHNVPNLNEYSQAVNGQQRNLLQTISGVLHSQSVRLSHGNNFNNNQTNNSNIGLRGASLHHINNGTRKGSGFATLHHPPNHSNTRKSIIGMQQQQQQQHTFANGSNQRATSFMVHSTGGNVVNNVNSNSNPVSRLNGTAIVSVDPVTGQTVTYNVNCTEAVSGQPTYISSSLSDGGMFMDGNNLCATNHVLRSNGDAQHRLASDNLNDNITDMGVTPGEYVRQLLKQHRTNNAPTISGQQFGRQNITTQGLNSSMAQQTPITTAGPVCLPQPQFAHPIASATAAKI